MIKIASYKYWIICGLSFAFGVVYCSTTNDCEEALIGINISVDPAKDPAEELYMDGRKQLIFDAYDTAILLFHEYLENYPDHKYAPSAQYWLGVSFLSKGDFIKAKTTFQDFQGAHPTHYEFDDSLYDLAQTHIALGEVSEAILLLYDLLNVCGHNNFICSKAKKSLSILEAPDEL